MVRRVLEVGTYGDIWVQQLPSKKWEARAQIRMENGKNKPVARRGISASDAKTRLKAALATLQEEVTSGEVTTASRFGFAADLWHKELARESKLGDISAGTVRTYRSNLTHWILPAMGELRCNRRELTTAVCDRVVKNARDKGSYEIAKTTRSVLSGCCGFLIRHGCLEHNPVRSIARLPRGEEKTVVALTRDQRGDLHAKLRNLAVTRMTDSAGRSLGRRSQIWEGLPDLYEAMLSTGVRIGELLAISGDEIDPTASTVAIDWHLVYAAGEGLVRKWKRKSGAPSLLLRVPEWSVPMWRRRKLASGGGPAWPAWSGGWQNPSNVIHRIREALDECGYEWVTSHVFRKTVATVLDEAGLPLGAVADQLGNTRQVAEQRYVAKRVANAESAAALEGMLDRRDRDVG